MSDQEKLKLIIKTNITPTTVFNDKNLTTKPCLIFDSTLFPVNKTLIIIYIFKDIFSHDDVYKSIYFFESVTNVE